MLRRDWTVRAAGLGSRYSSAVSTDARMAAETWLSVFVTKALLHYNLKCCTWKSRKRRNFSHSEYKKQKMSMRVTVSDIMLQVVLPKRPHFVCFGRQLSHAFSRTIRGVARESRIIRDATWRQKKKAPLTRKVKLLQGRVIHQSPGKLLRTFVPDIVNCATSQANIFLGAGRENCPIRDAEGRGRRGRLHSP